MTQDEIVRKHKEYLFSCVQTYYKDRLAIDHGKGQYLYDLEGKQYLDSRGGIVTISVGHANEKVTSKIKAQIGRLQHASTLFPSEPIVALAEKVAQIAPGKLQKSYFTNSGSEANEVAVLTARMHTGLYDVVAVVVRDRTRRACRLAGVAADADLGVDQVLLDDPDMDDGLFHQSNLTYSKSIGCRLMPIAGGAIQPANLPGSTR